MNPYSRLEGWVFHATFTLAQPEGPREELRQRLMERTAALEAQGLNVAQAQEKAVQEAGNSSEVRRQLERTHLTQEEQKEFDVLYEKPYDYRGLIHDSFIAVLFLTIVSFIFTDVWSLLAFLLSVYAFIVLVKFILISFNNRFLLFEFKWWLKFLNILMIPGFYFTVFSRPIPIIAVLGLLLISALVSTLFYQKELKIKLKIYPKLRILAARA